MSPRNKAQKLAHNIDLTTTPAQANSFVEAPSAHVWELIARKDESSRCPHNSLSWHVPQDCWLCVQRRVAYEVLTGGCTSRTFLQLALAFQRHVDHDGKPAPLTRQARGAVGDALDRDPQSPLLLCAVGTYRAEGATNTRDLLEGIYDLTAAVKLEPKLLLASYNLAAAYDKMAIRLSKGIEKMRKPSMEGYSFVLDMLANDDHPPITRDMVKARLELLRGHDLATRLKDPQFLEVPSEWLLSYIKGWKRSHQKCLKINRFDELHLEVADCIRVAMEEGVIRKRVPAPVACCGARNLGKAGGRKKIKTNSAVDDLFCELLTHLRCNLNPRITSRQLRNILLMHFRKAQNRDGTVCHELRKVLDFFGETIDS